MTPLITDDERPGQGAHLADGELLFLAGERQDAARAASLRFEDAPERDWGRHHLEGCAECGRRLALLERRARRLSALVAEIDVPPEFRHPVLGARPRWRPGGLLRAAAIVLVVLSSLLLAPPVRGWALGWMHAGWSRITAGRPAGGARAQSVEAPPAGVGARVGFAPMSEEVAVVVAEQAGGALVLTTTSAPAVTVEIVGGTGAETPLVHDGGLRILNDPSSRASYRVALPPSVQRIRVSVGTRAGVLIERARIGRELRIDLR